MKTSELIEKQIERAHALLKGFGPTFDRPKEISSGILALGNICDVLIRIVQNQQAQIVELNAAIDGFNSFVAKNDLGVALRGLDDIVRRGQAGEFYKGGK